MQNSIRLLLITAPLIGACAGSFPPPTQRLADAQSAERSAREVGANDAPAAQLSLKLAQDQIGMAQKAMVEGDNRVPLADGHDGLRALEVAAAVRQSTASGAAVHLPALGRMRDK